MGESKINVKVGIVEFSGEGEQEWLAKQLDKILEKVPELLKIEITPPKTDDTGNINSNSSSTRTSTLELSMVNVASKLNCKSGQDLATTAAAFLTFVQGKNTFTRDEILQSMKVATGYYKGTYNNNLTKILVALVKNNTLNQSSTNAYSLHVNKENELNAILLR